MKDFFISGSDDCEVIKLYGDFEDDDFIVLIEIDYFNWFFFEFLFDIRFCFDVLVCLVLFIGYSLIDINVRMLFYKFWEIWNLLLYWNYKFYFYIFFLIFNEIEEKVFV